MKIRKAAAALTAAACFVGTFSGFPGFDTAKNVQAAVSNDFEINYGGWCKYGDDAELTAVYDGYKDTRSMCVSGRNSGADGAVSQKGLYLYGGIKYHYSVMVRGSEDDTFYLTLRWLDPETGKYSSEAIASADIGAGEWVELKTDYTAPDGTADLTLFITSDKSGDFCFDDVKVTEKSGGLVYAATAEKGLKDEFAKYFKVGTAVPWNLISDSRAKAIILKDFNSITCENELKPDATLIKSNCSGTDIGVQIGTGAASIMDFCVENNIAMRGHTMVWYSQTPEWFFKKDFNASNDYVNQSTMDARLESYIKNMFSTIKQQYPDLNLYCYDICNECISDSSDNTKTAGFNSDGTFNYGGGRNAGYGDGKSPWVQIYGSNVFMEKAYTYARKYAPVGCKLFYNDYNEYWDHKRDCIYTTCKYLYDKGLLDGIGMQSHIAADGDYGFTGMINYRTAINKYASIGCEVQITELDIDIKTDSATYSDSDQANKYKAIFQAAMDLNTKGNANGNGEKYPGKITAFCVWGVDDAHSWVNMNNDVGSDPLLYDSSFQPKTAYNTVTAMIPVSEWGDGSGSSAQEPNEYGWYFDSAFESDTEGWTARGSNSIEVSTDEHYVGSKSLYVSNRTATWNGPTKALDTATYVPGTQYSFSANVKYNSGAEIEPFYLKLQYNDADGKTHYATIAESTAIKGSWVQLAEKNFTIPEGATDLQLYIETGNTTCDFYVDEVIAAVAGTGITGAGVQKVILGDLNMDGKVNSADYRKAALAVKKGTALGTLEKSAADVDQNGSVDSDDAEFIKQFVLGRITSFPKAVSQVDTAAMEALFANP